MDKQAGKVQPAAWLHGACTAMRCAGRARAWERAWPRRGAALMLRRGSSAPLPQRTSRGTTPWLMSWTSGHTRHPRHCTPGSSAAALARAAAQPRRSATSATKSIIKQSAAIEAAKGAAARRLGVWFHSLMRASGAGGAVAPHAYAVHSLFSGAYTIWSSSTRPQSLRLASMALPSGPGEGQADASSACHRWLEGPAR